MQLGDNVSRSRGLAPLFHTAGQNDQEFVLPKYSGQEFIQVMAVSLFVVSCAFSPAVSLYLCVCVQLLDLSALDITSQQFAPSVLASSAMYLALDGFKQHLKLFTGEA